MKWQIKQSEYLINDPWLKLRQDRCQMSNGKMIEPFYVLEYPDWVNIFGLTTQQEVVLVRQYRHGIGKVVVELPSGKVEVTDTNPLEAAKRELLEETGYTSDNFVQTVSVSPNPANQTNLTHCFLARELVKVTCSNPDETEEIETVLVPLAKAVDMFNRGDFLQALHVSSICFALKVLKSPLFSR